MRLPSDHAEPRIAVIGGGPAGLIAAEVLSAAGCAVTVYDRMPNVGRKFLLAGRGGLNLTHAEPRAAFVARYGSAAAALSPHLDAFPPGALAAWCASLGVATFVGTSGRVFPVTLKASPLLRAWLRRLDGQGVRFALRHRWTGWNDDGALAFETPAGSVNASPSATILALGGASWPRLGSDGGWRDILRAAGVDVTALEATNCGCEIAWSPLFREKFAGAPLKRIAVAAGGTPLRGEAMITRSGLEGGPIYALSTKVRDGLSNATGTTIEIDLRPDIGHAALALRLQRPRGKQSLSNHIRKTAGLSPAAVALLREDVAGTALPTDAQALAARIKGVALAVHGVAGLARAISTAGGIAFPEINEQLMLRRMPGVFVAGEMLDWEAPTGGYLLQACFSTGHAAARGVLGWLGRPADERPAPEWSLAAATTGTDGDGEVTRAPSSEPADDV